MKNRKVTITLAGVLVAFSPPLYGVLCGLEAADNTEIWQSIAGCPTSACYVYTFVGDLYCATGPAYAFCKMINDEGFNCHTDGEKHSRSGSCVWTGSGWSCNPGTTTTIIPAQVVVPCISGYDAEICPG